MKRLRSAELLVSLFTIAVIGGILAYVSNHNAHNSHAATGPAQVSVPASTGSGTFPPAGKVYFGGTNGADQNTFGGCTTPNPQDNFLECKMTAAGQVSGYKMPLLREYMNGGNACSDASEIKELVAGGDIYKRATAPGRKIVMLSTKCGNWAHFAAGDATLNQDIKNIVKDVEAWHVPVILVFHHEPENDSCDYNTKTSTETTGFGTPDDFRAAYRQFAADVRTQARADGANDIATGWVLMGFSYDQDFTSTGAAKNMPVFPGACGTLGTQSDTMRNATNWYPGDDAVDWPLADPYNPSYNKNTGKEVAKPSKSFSDIVNSFYKWNSIACPANHPTVNYSCTTATRAAKPLGLGEYSTGGDAPYRASWYKGMETELANFPKLKALAIWSSQVNGLHTATSNAYQVDYPLPTVDSAHSILGNDPNHLSLKAFTELSKLNIFNFSTSGGDQAPQVSITAPTGGTVRGSVTVNMAASDDHKVVSVKLYAGSTLLQTFSPNAASANPTYTWDTSSIANGTAVALKAVATDNASTPHTTTSAIVNVTVDNSVPTTDKWPSLHITAPTDGQVFTGITPLTVGMAANASDDNQISIIKFLTDGTLRNSVTGTAKTLSTTYNWVTGMSDNGQHTITVATTDNVGHTVSHAVAVTVTNKPQPGAPNKPSNLHTTGQTTSSVSLAWDADTDPDDASNTLVYHIKRNGTEVGHTAAGALSFTDTGRAPNTTYNYIVFATDPAGHVSPDSASLPVTTKGLNCTAPALPAHFAATNVTAVGATLSWNAVTPSPAACVIDHYIVQQGTKTVASVQTLNYALSGLTPKTAYTYSVRAVTIDGTTSSTGSTVSFTTPAAVDSTPPTAPGNLLAIPASTSQVNLSWDAASDPESSIKTYHIMRGSTEINTTTSTSFGDTNLSAGQTYTYTVVAENGAGMKTASTPVTVTTLTDDNGGGGQGGGGDGGQTDVPILDDTTSVGTGDDSGNSGDQHSYDATNGDVSDDPNALNGSATSSTSPTTAEPVNAKTKAKLGLPVRVAIGVGGLLLLLGVPVAASLILKRLPVALATSGDTWDEARAGTSQDAGRVISPTNPPEDEGKDK